MKPNNAKDLAFAMGVQIGSGIPLIQKGLTKREYMATQVIAGLCARTTVNPNSVEYLAETAVDIVDALLARLEEK